MPKYEILHSGEYWQTLRRAKAEHKARQRHPDYVHPDYVPSGTIYTFLPPRPNGSLTPLSSTPCTNRSIHHAPKKVTYGKYPVLSADARAAAADQELLARLAETPQERMKRKRCEEVADQRRAQKKKVSPATHLVSIC
jgi:hypothetical protein